MQINYLAMLFINILFSTLGWILVEHDCFNTNSFIFHRDFFSDSKDSNRFPDFENLLVIPFNTTFFCITLNLRLFSILESINF